MNISALNQDPILQFLAWYQQAQTADESDVDAMALATASKVGQPSVRYVLYKGIENGGFLIYTNYESNKAKDLAENPKAALAFYWPKSYRQVRVEGTIKKLTPEESEQYFNSRSRESQIGAWSSKQSRQITSRAELEESYATYSKKFNEGKIPCPDFWGGYVLLPEAIEFWQGQAHRLHDRFRYQRNNSTWEIIRLAP